MKNKKIIILLSIILLSLTILSCITIFAIDSIKNDNGDTAGQNSEAFGASLSDKKADKTKEISIWDVEKITYKETMNLSNLPVDKRNDSYGTYDVYTDKDNNLYYFLYNADLLCGYKDETVYMDIEEPEIEIEQAIDISEKFIKDNIKPTIQYKYTYSYYDKSYGVYKIKYNYYIENIKTDDECMIWVKAIDGKIGAFTAFKQNRYENIKNVNIQESKMKELLDNEISRMNKGEYKVRDQYFSYSDGGKLIMNYEVYFSETGKLIPIIIEVIQ